MVRKPAAFIYGFGEFQDLREPVGIVGRAIDPVQGPLNAVYESPDQVRPGLQQVASRDEDREIDISDRRADGLFLSGPRQPVGKTHNYHKICIYSHTVKYRPAPSRTQSIVSEFSVFFGITGK
jgi:hypothetical protein